MSMTEAIEHRCTLMERHRIMLDHDSIPGLDGEQMIRTCRREADRWADAHDLEVSNVSVVQWGDGLGVEFDVIVGKGRIDLDQRQPGALDTWTWSGRFQWWRRVLTNADGRRGDVLARREDVVPAFHRRADTRRMFDVRRSEGEVPRVVKHDYPISVPAELVEMNRTSPVADLQRAPGDEAVERATLRRERCGECYQLGGEHAVDCTRVTGQ